MNMPAGITIYIYPDNPDVGVQSSPFATFNEMLNELRDDLTKHDCFDIESYILCVRDKEDVDKLFALMDELKDRPCVHGSKAKVCALTPELARMYA